MKYTANRFFQKVNDHFSEFFGDAYRWQCTADGLYISRRGYDCYFLPGVAMCTTGGSSAEKNRVTGFSGIFADAVRICKTEAAEAVPGVSPSALFKRDSRLIRYTVPGAPEPVYINRRLLKPFPASARLLFNTARPHNSPAVVTIPGEDGEPVPVALVLPVRLFGNARFIPEV